MSGKKFLKFGLNTLALFLGVWLFYIAFKKIDFSEIWAAFSNAVPIYILFFFIFSFFRFFLWAFKWKTIIKAMNYSVGIFRLFMIRLAGFFIGFITPSANLGGEPVRMYLLKKEGVEIHDSLSSVIMDKFFELVVNYLLVFVAFVMIIIKFTISSSVEIFLAVATIFVTVPLVVFYLRIINEKLFFSPILRFLGFHGIKRLRKYLPKIERSERAIMHFFKNHKSVFWANIFLNFMAWVVTMISLKFAFLMINYDVSFLYIFFLMAVFAIAYSLPVPAGLGTAELGGVYLFSILGLSKNIGIVISLIYKFRDFIFSLIGSTLFVHNGIKSVSLKGAFSTKKKRKTKPVYSSSFSINNFFSNRGLGGSSNDSSDKISRRNSSNNRTNIRKNKK